MNYGLFTQEGNERAHSLILSVPSVSVRNRNQALERANKISEQLVKEGYDEAFDTMVRDTLFIKLMVQSKVELDDKMKKFAKYFVAQ